MLHINEIELYHEPRKNVESIFAEIPNEPEMSVDESAFLCGLIKKHKPRKIVEVGVAGGGTSAIILSCMKLLGLNDSMLYSVDYLKRFYLDERYESGYLGKKARKHFELPEEKHVLLTGDIACSFSELKEGIDFLIIDTMHILPGELLDFVTLLPALSDNAVVVLHDVALPYQAVTEKDAIATGVLLASATGEKYINTIAFSGAYANIAAIEIDKNTKEQIANVFSALFVPWKYMPENRQLTGYREVIERNYPQVLVDMFDAAVTMNGNLKQKKNQPVWLFPFDKVSAGSKVIFFGAGEVGSVFKDQLRHTGYCEVVKVVDNDQKKWHGEIHEPAEILKTEYDYVVITIGKKEIAAKIKEQLLEMGVSEADIIWNQYRFVE